MPVSLACFFDEIKKKQGNLISLNFRDTTFLTRREKHKQTNKIRNIVIVLTLNMSMTKTFFEL